MRKPLSSLVLFFLFLFIGAQLASLSHAHLADDSHQEESSCLFCLKSHSPMDSQGGQPQFFFLEPPFSQPCFLKPWILGSLQLITPQFSRPPPVIFFS